jgi:hypothetical protein
VLGEVVGGDEAEHVSLEAFEVVVVEHPDGCFLHSSVHAFGLTVGPGVIRLRQPMLNAMLETNAIEDMWSEEAPGWSLTILG